MNINELYAELSRRLKNNVLVIDGEILGNAFFALTEAFAVKEITVTRCALSVYADRIKLGGSVVIEPFDVLGAGALSVDIRVDNDVVSFEARIVVNGKGKLRDICPLIRKNGFFSEFTVKNPEICVSSNMIGYRISGTAGLNSDNGSVLESRTGITLPELMSFAGYVRTDFGRTMYALDFSIGSREIAFPCGTAEAELALRTVDSRRGFFYDPEIRAFLLLKIKNGAGEGITFRVDVTNSAPSDNGGGLYAGAVFSPVLSPANIAKYLGDLFAIPAEGIAAALPEKTVLSGFGLQRLGVRIKSAANGGFELEYMEAALALQQPWSTPVSGLELSELTVFTEASIMSGRPIISVSVSCTASMTFGKYTLIGRAKGYFPQQRFEGSLELHKTESAAENGAKETLTLAEMAEEFGCPMPDDWGKPLAAFGLTADLRERSYSLNVVANGIIEISVGGLKISVDSIYAEAEIRPSGNSFGFCGKFGFSAGDERFQIAVQARYDEGCWNFAGGLSSGEINIGKLLSGLFGISASKSSVGIVVKELSVGFTPSKGKFSVNAAIGTTGFSVLGYRLDLGGRIKIEKDSEHLYGAALFYLDIGALELVVQADDFFTENIKFLFRLAFNKLYLQGVYYKDKNGEEIVRFSLGGMTFADVVLAFIRLVNPNAKNSLPTPWNILNKINLSDFSIVINAAQKTAAVIYSANIFVAGLMRIDEIGVRYSFKKADDCRGDRHKLDFILTGKLLDKTYGLDDPLTWDVLDGAPPDNTAAAQTKTKVAYIGLGSKMKIEIDSSSVTDAVETLKQRLKPVSDVPEFQYDEKNGWLFGLDLTIKDMFRLQAAFIDPCLYGAKITIDVTDKSPLYFFNGLELELVYQKISDSVGMLRCTLTLPKRMSRLDLGAVVITLGEISLEIYTNGSFYIDLGFPHNGDFSRSFGLEYGIFTGRGGVYFGTLTGDAARNVPKITNGNFSPVVLIGIGIKAGIGRSFDFGIIKGGVSLTASAILEGVFAVFNPSDKNSKGAAYYLVHAVAGVSGTLFLSADLKIISISVSACVIASCDLTIESFRKSVMKLSLYLELSASIRILFFKIEFSFVFDKTIEFAFGKDQPTPWKLEDANASAAGLAELHALNLFPCVKLGDREIEVCTAPLFSVKDPNAAELQYCAALLCVVTEKDFSTLFELLVDWLSSSFSGEIITRDDAEALPTNAEERVSLSDLENFFEKNLRVNIKPEVGGENSSDALNGAFFPMPHHLKLVCGNIEHDLSVNIVSEDYCQTVNEYLAKLNADPLHVISYTAARGAGIPICGTIFIDYFRMFLSEIISLFRGSFENTKTRAASFADLSKRFEISAEELLNRNAGLTLNVDTLPKYTYIIREGDTLNSICGRFSLSAEALWSNAAGVSMLPARGRVIKLHNHVFDNSAVKLSVTEAAAIFFVRMRNPDVIYFRYAEKIVEDNDLEPDWECGEIGGRELIVPWRSGKYTALAGDNAVRLAKAAALINGASADGWESFLKRFSEDNTEGAAEYKINGEYVIGDNTLNELARRLCPDFDGLARESFLWKLPILCEWKDVVLCGARVGLAGVSADRSGISSNELAAALEAGTAEFSRAQDVTVSPRALSKSALRETLITKENISRTSAVLSRFFLQGLRIPSPDNKGAVTPLFELLGQQFNIDPPRDRFTFSIKKADDCGWLIVDENTAVLEGQALDDAVPNGRLTALPPQKAADFSEVPRYWSARAEILLRNGLQQTLCTLPGEMREYLSRNAADTVKTEGSPEAAAWANLTGFGIVKTSAHICRLGGASPRERSALRKCCAQRIKEIRVLIAPSKFDTESADYVEIAPESCVLVRTDLSTETHIESRVFRKSKGFENIAGIDEPNEFLLLAWECSVIGGGFSLCCSDIPESAFDEDGKAMIYLLTVFEKDGLCGSFVNCAVFGEKLGGDPVFIGSADKIFTPNYPVGSVGIRAEKDARDSAMSELFGVMGYSARTETGVLLESMPILPRKKSDGAEFYETAVPLYRLCANSDSPYSAVGKCFTIDIFQRDVLGNTVKTGETELCADYNDFVIGINEIPCTDTNYVVVKRGEGAAIVVSSRFAFDPNADVKAAAEAALAASLQAECEIEISFLSTLGATYTLNANELEQYRRYVRAVYETLDSGARKCGAELSFSFDADPAAVPSKVFKIALTSKIERKNTGLEYEGVRFAENVVLRGEGYEEKFREALPGVILAAGASDLYGIPRNSYFEGIQISPFTLVTESGSVRSPRFYSTAPFSRGLITRETAVTSFDGESLRVGYVDTDIEFWAKRLLEDVERMLDGEVLAEAVMRCPALVEKVVETKGILAQRFAERLAPLVDGFGGDDLAAACETAEQLFKRSLLFVYDTDVFGVYKAVIRHSGGPCRLEGDLVGAPAEIGCGKVDAEKKYFCVYSSGKLLHSNERCNPSLSFAHFEYDVQTDPSGYESSKWLRLLAPLGFGEIDLRAEAGIPHPLKFFPESPRLLQHEFGSDVDTLRYTYSARISCKAYEQQTVYLRLRFEENKNNRAIGEDYLFGVLADYDFKREKLLHALSEAGNDFEKAYGIAADAAGKFAEAMSYRTPNTAFAAGCGEVILKIRFKLSDSVEFNCEVYGEESKAFIRRHKIRVNAPRLVSGGEHGGDLVFESGLSELPIFACPIVEPSVWIVQNRDLFDCCGVCVNEAFVFQTEEVSLAPLRIRADFRAAFTASGIESAVQRAWETLELSENQKRCSAAVTCCFDLSSLGKKAPLIRLPSVFLPEVSSPGEISRAVRDWLSSSGTGSPPSALILKIGVFGEDKFGHIVDAEVTVDLNN